MMLTARPVEYWVTMYLSPAASHTLQVFGTWEKMGQITVFFMGQELFR